MIHSEKVLILTPNHDDDEKIYFSSVAIFVSAAICGQFRIAYILTAQRIESGFDGLVILRTIKSIKMTFLIAKLLCRSKCPPVC